MLAILSSFDAANYVLSIASFLFAIASIVIGFKFNYKALRVYGLVLSMLSTIKLILVDIGYNGTAQKALCFFICGLLCFAISAIYNWFDKRTKML